MGDTWWPKCSHCRKPLNECSCAELNAIEASAINSTMMENISPTAVVTARVVDTHKIVVSVTSRSVKFVN